MSEVNCYFYVLYECLIKREHFSYQVCQNYLFDNVKYKKLFSNTDFFPYYLPSLYIKGFIYILKLHDDRQIRLQTSSIKTFQPIIWIYRWGYFIDHQWGYIWIYRPLSYHLRSLYNYIITWMIWHTCWELSSLIVSPMYLKLFSS